MKSTPLESVQDAIIQSLEEDRPIHSVLICPQAWLGFLLQIDRPEKYEDLKKLECIDGQEIVQRYMKRVLRCSFFDSEVPFHFKLNTHINDVRVILYSETV